MLRSLRALMAAAKPRAGMRRLAVATAGATLGGATCATIAFTPAQAEGEEKLAGAALMGIVAGWYLGGSGPGAMTDKTMTELISSIKKSHPDNIAMSCFDFGYYNSLSPDLQKRMLACARSGFENPDSGMGAYAIQPDDYDVLTPYLDACIRKYHKVPAGQKHVNDWSLEGVEGLPADGKLDVTKLGLGELSMRVRTGRNLKAFPLPGGMSLQDRKDMENVMVKAFSTLINEPAYGGRYVSLTPGHPNQIADGEYNQLVKVPPSTPLSLSVCLSLSPPPPQPCSPA